MVVAGAVAVVVGFVGYLLLVVLVDAHSRGVVGTGSVIGVTDVSVVVRDVGCAVDYAAFAATISITLNSRDSIEEREAGVWRAGAVEHTDDDVRLAEDVVGGGCGCFVVIAYRTFPSAAIDVTHRSALDIDVGRSDEVLYSLPVLDSSAGACAVEVLDDCAAEEVDIRRAADNCIGTESGTIAVAANCGTLLDADVGVVFLLSIVCAWGLPTFFAVDDASLQVVFHLAVVGHVACETEVCIGRCRSGLGKGEVDGGIFSLPGIDGLEVKDFACLAAAVNLID